MEEKRCYGCMRMKSGEICEYCGQDDSISNEPHQLQAGTVLKEQYLIGKVLGQGGFGITYLGWDLYLDIPVAVKEYFPNGTVMRETSVSMDVVSYSGDVGVRFRNNKERFMREAKMLARFSQVPEIVQIKNFFLANNTAYIVMEYVQGITLKQYVKENKGKLSVEETFSLMKPVIQALCKVHKAGLVHRDISPDNIMMLPEGRVKLLDFGAVRDVGEPAVDQPLTKSTEAILKQGYAPIEQYQNRGSLGPWTDVYALCGTIYYCLTGEVPPDAPERLLGEEEIDFKGLIPELSDRQAEILRQGMALRTGERIASMDELYHRMFEEPEASEGTVISGQTWTEAERKKSQVPFDGKEQNAMSFDDKEKKPRFSDNWKRGRKLAIGVLALAAVVLVVVIVVQGTKQEQGAGTVAKDSNPSSAEMEEKPEITGEIIVNGRCGENAYWELDRSSGILTITGEGAMYDFNGSWMGKDGNEEPYPEREYQPWFVYQEEILSVVIEDGITVVGENAFENCCNLKEVDWSEGLQEIRSQAFLSTALQEIELPEGLIIIRSWAFNYCESLTVLVLPESLERVENCAFNCCGSLRKVTFLGTNTETEIRVSDFQGKIYTPFTDERTYKHPENLVICGYQDSVAQDFANNYSLVFFNLGEPEDPKLTGRCGDDITWRMDLEEKTLYLEGNGETWLYYLDEGGKQEYAKNYPEEWIRYGCPEWYIYRHIIEKVVVGEGITALNYYVFMDLYNLQQADLGSVEEANSAFSHCGIREITFPETMSRFGGEVLGHCEKLKKVTVLNGSDYISEGFLEGCLALEEVYFSREADITGNILSSDGGTYSKKVVFYVYEGSSAMKFAIDNDIPYEIRKD